MSRLGIGRGEAIIDFELEESLDDEEEDNTIDGASSITQTATRPSSYSVEGCGRAIALRIGVEEGDAPH
jgi:hypothetical protein